MSKKHPINDLVRLFDRDAAAKLSQLKQLGTRQDGIDKVNQAKRQFEQQVDIFLAAVDDDLKDKTWTKLEQIHKLVTQVETRDRKTARDEDNKRSFRQYMAKRDKGQSTYKP